MKRLHYLSLFIVALFATSCSYNELPEELRVEPIFEDKITLNVETRAETYEGKALDQEYFVTAQDLENFVKFRRDASKRPNLSVKEVVSYGFDNSQTLFYILNYDEGWEVISADKRTQPTLAHGDEGSFTMDTDNEAMKFWMQTLANEVLQTRKQIEDATRTGNSDTVNEESLNYINFWDSITPIDKKMETRTPRIGNDNLTSPEYHYIYLLEYETIIDTIKYGPFTHTTWGQGPPWNQFCPFISNNSSTSRAYTGCTATAGAQLLYYFCHRLGIWLDIPSYVNCTGYIGDYEYTFDSYTNRMWTQMARDRNDVIGAVNTAKLMSFIGYLSDMKYRESSSGAYPSDLMDSLEQLYNIHYNKLDFMDNGIVMDNLQRQMPALIWGASTSTGKGHTWLIDGYAKETITRKIYYARFETEQDPSYIAQLNKEDANYISQSTSYNWWYYMNWGWDGTNNNQTYSTLSSDWTFDNVVEIYYGFQIR